MWCLLELPSLCEPCSLWGLLRMGSPCGPSPPAPLWLCSMKGTTAASWGCVQVSLEDIL